jgi:hypothetical protein
MRHLKRGSLLKNLSQNRVVIEIEIGKEVFSSNEIEDDLENVNFNGHFHKKLIVIDLLDSIFQRKKNIKLFILFFEFFFERQYQL